MDQCNNRKSQKGFTLIELLIAIVIIAILSTAFIAFLNPLEQIKKTRDSQRKHDFDQLRKALEIYFIDNDSVYPLAVNGKINGIDWGDPFPPFPPYIMGNLPKDPLSTQPYCYESDANGTYYRLYAKLEKDPTTTLAGTNCTDYNYSVNSPNIAVAVAPTPTPPVPTPTPTAITIALNNKFNFISLPVTPPDTNVATIISAIADKIELIYYFDGNLQSWFVYDVQSSSGTLLTLEPGKGYVVKMRTISSVVQTANLQITGIPFVFQPISLQQDKWYMIGAPYTDVKLSDVIGTCTLANIQLSTIDGATGVNISMVVDSNTLLSSGRGYQTRSINMACTLSL